MSRVLRTIRLIEKQVRGFNIPWVTKVSKKKDPFKVLISCILSLRTKDKATHLASNKLFAAADTPRKMIRLSADRIEKLIYPVGFYRNKARFILGISKRLIEDFGCRVPETREELLSLKGVGRKTANLVLGLGYNIPAICVDTHVHRISNRLGWVHTRNPYQTEEALERIVPKDYWIKLNTVMVAFGQNICVPVTPFCSRCFVRDLCENRGVTRSR